jgi:hypothetical protein
VIKSHGLGLVARNFKQAKRRHARVLAGRLGNLETEPDMALAGEMIKLSRLHLVKNAPQGRPVGEIAVREEQFFAVNFVVATKMFDTRAQQIARSPDNPVNDVAFCQKQLGQIRTVLASDAGD